ncbi:proteasome regulatory particle subunit [Malassezia cuniculi]|uniref:Proteasome regulatory particle subunit n=1 Tax=Malassezia cuniculi TaxID=948313 RepID=A0AAF0EZ92_9BASI|nr:proteasome regulatory particle subunit [Malassezia cuniculi]
MDDESVPHIPNQQLQQELFVVMRAATAADKRAAAVTALIDGIRQDEMAPYYRLLLDDPAVAKHIPRDDALLAELEEKNKKELDRLDAAQKQAEESEGDLELHTVLTQRAQYLARIGDKEAALRAHDAALERATGLGSKIDLTLTKIRLGLFFGDTGLTQSSIAAASALIEEGGDWDRRNRLTAYRAVYLASVRHFSEASSLSRSALSTFTATELISYVDFVRLTVLMGLVSLSRPDQKKLSEAPEVIQTISDMPRVGALASSLYNSEYAAFFQALADVEQEYLLPSRILAPHARYYVREMRVIAFTQLLESYRSVAIDKMAAAFGVTPEYIDAELSRFISAGRLPAVIDKAAGTIENRRPDVKNAQYNRIIKEGDVLLNSLQKLSRTAL